jgi:hypothetical protein
VAAREDHHEDNEDARNGGEGERDRRGATRRRWRRRRRRPDDLRTLSPHFDLARLVHEERATERGQSLVLLETLAARGAHHAVAFV